MSFQRRSIKVFHSHFVTPYPVSVSNRYIAGGCVHDLDAALEVAQYHCNVVEPTPGEESLALVHQRLPREEQDISRLGASSEQFFGNSQFLFRLHNMIRTFQNLG